MVEMPVGRQENLRGEEEKWRGAKQKSNGEQNSAVPRLTGNTVVTATKYLYSSTVFIYQGLSSRRIPVDSESQGSSRCRGL